MVPVAGCVVAGLFSGDDQARIAVDELRRAGFEQRGIRTINWWDEGALRDLGIPPADIADYAPRLQSGGTLVCVLGGDRESAERAASMLDQLGALEPGPAIQERPSDEVVGEDPGGEQASEDEIRREHHWYDAGGHHATEWSPETKREAEHSAEVPGTVWPHQEARDIGESLMSAAVPLDTRRHRSRIYSGNA